VPAILFYLTLILQVDGYAAVNALKRQPAAEIPSLWEILRDGRFYLASLAKLVYWLALARLERYPPYYATLALLVASAIFRKQNRFNFKQFLELMVSAVVMAIVYGLLLMHARHQRLTAHEV